MVNGYQSILPQVSDAAIKATINASICAGQRRSYLLSSGNEEVPVAAAVCSLLLLYYIERVTRSINEERKITQEKTLSITLTTCGGEEEKEKVSSC